MKPIKMKDGRLAHPITTVPQYEEHIARGDRIEHNAHANEPTYSDESDAGGWLDSREWPEAMPAVIRSGHFLIRAVTPATATPATVTLWQRSKGWFA